MKEKKNLGFCFSIFIHLLVSLTGSPAIFLTKNCFKDKLYKPELIHQCISPGE